MCFLSGGKVNPLIGSAGVSAVPMAGCRLPAGHVWIKEAGKCLLPNRVEILNE